MDYCLNDFRFFFRHKGFSDVMIEKSGPPKIVGAVLRVKNATENAKWVFLPTREFRRSFSKPYERFCFGNNRRNALAHFLMGKHLVFRTDGDRPWLVSEHTLSIRNRRKEVQE